MSPGKTPAPHAAATARLVADLLKRAAHPDVTGVAVLDTPTVRIDLADGSTNYVKVAHVQPPGGRGHPDVPSWPGHVTAKGGSR